MSEPITLQDKKNALKLAYQIVTDKRNLNRYACTALVRKDSPEMFTYSDMVKALEGIYTELEKAPMMQKPLTLEEVKKHCKGMHASPLWIETRKAACWIYAHVDDDEMNKGTLATIKDDWLNSGMVYGVKWRCWASRPTDEEHAAAPWEG